MLQRQGLALACQAWQARMTRELFGRLARSHPEGSPTLLRAFPVSSTVSNSATNAATPEDVCCVRAMMFREFNVGVRR